MGPNQLQFSDKPTNQELRTEVGKLFGITNAASTENYEPTRLSSLDDEGGRTPFAPEQPKTSAPDRGAPPSQ